MKILILALALLSAPKLTPAPAIYLPLQGSLNPLKGGSANAAYYEGAVLQGDTQIPWLAGGINLLTASTGYVRMPAAYNAVQGTFVYVFTPAWNSNDGANHTLMVMCPAKTGVATSSIALFKGFALGLNALGLGLDSNGDGVIDKSVAGVCTSSWTAGQRVIISGYYKTGLCRLYLNGALFASNATGNVSGDAALTSPVISLGYPFAPYALQSDAVVGPVALWPWAITDATWQLNLYRALSR